MAHDRPYRSARNPQLARRLRRDATDVERMLWRRLRNGQVDGLRFRRQHPTGPFVADFAYPSRRLAIELDGGQHAFQQKRDFARTADLESRGYRVLRFWNVDVTGNIDGVVDVIRRAAAKPPSSP